VDDPERLKRFLYESWKERALGYVLFVGDGDIQPLRYIVTDRKTPAAFDYAFCPTDLYYSDLARPDGSFDDWNARKEGFHARYFGEIRGEKNKQDPINYDAVDYRPDIAVGRWPVSTPEEAARVAAKTIAYESAIPFRRAGFFCNDGWVDFRARMDSWMDHMPRNWSFERRYFGTEVTPPPDSGEMMTFLNEGVGLLCHVGHGSDHTWEGCLSIKGLSQARNAGRLPIMMSVGCSTATFISSGPYGPYRDVDGVEHAGTNHKEVFSGPPPPPAPIQPRKHLLKGVGRHLVTASADGAVAYIGCNTGSQPCAITLMEGFVAALGRAAKPRLGDLWAQAIACYHEK
jgi:hypothetical protein